MNKITRESITQCANELRQAMKDKKPSPVVYVERRLSDYETGVVKAKIFRPAPLVYGCFGRYE